jgi:hypothetical protein
VEGSCEHGNKPSGYHNMLGSSLVAAHPAASQKGLSSMKLAGGKKPRHHRRCSFPAMEPVTVRPACLYLYYVAFDSATSD